MPPLKNWFARLPVWWLAFLIVVILLALGVGVWIALQPKKNARHEYNCRQLQSIVRAEITLRFSSAWAARRPDHRLIDVIEFGEVSEVIRNAVRQSSWVAIEQSEELDVVFRRSDLWSLDPSQPGYWIAAIRKKRTGEICCVIAASGDSVSDSRMFGDFADGSRGSDEFVVMDVEAEMINRFRKWY